MAHVITSGAATTAQFSIVGYESTRESGNVVHKIIARAAPDVSMRVAGLRMGRMTLAFTAPSAEADSAAAEALLAVASVFTLTSDQTSVSMTFTLAENGRLGRALSDTGGAWRITFDWQEVAP